MEALLIGLVAATLVVGVVLLVLVVLLSRGVRGVRGGAPDAQESVRGEIRDLATLLREDLGRQRAELSEQLHRDASTARTAEEQLRRAVDEQLTALRRDNETRLEKIREAVDEKLQARLATSLTENADRIQALTAANAEKQTELQALLRAELDRLRRENEAKLEQMRQTVDEKLQGTLEKRLGESFTLVSQRLEEVQKGLGEMQNLASDVGGLKRVLTNVKNRGGWGEVLLERQLEDLLTREQYEANVAVRPGSAERVEFAVRLPGRDEAGSIVYLPIDSKFPQEDYERLLDAQERGEKVELEEMGRALERAVFEQAKTIAKKYIEPPFSTDFAIMYLPTEGLFAEVVRRPGLASRLQSEQRVLITGPTTLMSLLNSLQMGFRTLAIEKRSSEVWQVLAAAKVEFRKYGEVWSKLEKQLQTAQNTVTEAGRRTRAVERKLRDVEALDGPVQDPSALAAAVLDIDELDDFDPIGEASDDPAEARL